MVEVLFTRPADNSAAAQIATWGQVLLQRIGSRTYSDLAGAAATRAAVDQELDSGASSLFHFGHGTEDSLLGHGGAIIDGANASAVPEMIVAVACDSAVNLGPDAVARGTRAYLGFDDVVVIPSRAPFPVGFAVSTGLECLFSRSHPIDCATSQVRQGLETARRQYKDQGLEYGLDQSEARLACVFMKHNLHSLQLLGDPHTTI